MENEYNNVNKVIVIYKNKEDVIDNQDKIWELLKEFKNLEYNDYNYLKSMRKSSFDENDIRSIFAILCKKCYNTDILY